MKKFLLIFLTTFLYINHSISSTIISHKAFYELDLIQDNSSGDFQGGSGETISLFSQKCNGWFLKETFAISFNIKNQENKKNFSIFSTFEDYKSKSFSFEHLDNSGDKNENFYSGFVEKKNNGLEGMLIDKKNEIFKFNDKILFPTEHLNLLLKYAQKNKNFLTAKVFFGSDKNKLIKIVSAFIGPKRKSNLNFNHKLLKETVWPIKLAFYELNQKGSTPSTTIYVDLDINGIAHNYLVDYGNYKMKGKLSKIESVKREKC